MLYALTAGIAGYVAASYYKQMEGANWVRNVLTTCFVFCGPFFLMFCFNNTVAIVYRVRFFSSFANCRRRTANAGYCAVCSYVSIAP